MDTRASLTAQGIAIMRALESEKPEGERLFYDPYARRFVNPALLWVTRLFTDTGYAERRGPGVQGFLLARTRYIDDFLFACLAEGIQQLVILGAGYDARAYRFADALAGKVRVFEIDHPATQRVKIERLRRIFGELPGHVVYVPIDFNREALGQRLAECGYVESARTLFIWEGVTMYLAAAAVDGTLAFIAGQSAAGSAVIFDYAYASVIEGRVKRGEASGMRRYQRFTGEGLTFGIQEGTVERFLAERGFERARDARAQDLERLYFGTGSEPRKRVAPVYGIATGVVGNLAYDFLSCGTVWV